MEKAGSVPMRRANSTNSGIWLSFEPVADHVLGQIAGCVDHATAVAQESEPFVLEGLCQVGAEGIGVGGEQHLVCPYRAFFAQFENVTRIGVGGVGHEVGGETFPFVTDTFHLTTGIFLAAVGALQGYLYLGDRTMQIERVVKYRVFHYADSPLVEPAVSRAVALFAADALCISAGKGIFAVVSIRGRFSYGVPHV